MAVMPTGTVAPRHLFHRRKALIAITTRSHPLADPLIRIRRQNRSSDQAVGVIRSAEDRALGFLFGL